MRRARLIAMAVALTAAAPAWANCFTVFDRSNVIVYRSWITPIDLSGPISAALPARFPGGHLVISNDMTQCTPVEPSSPVNPMAGVLGTTR
jgi:hypothetical protein